MAAALTETCRGYTRAPMPIATHLLLDPKLPEEIRAYFRDRAANNAPPFQCVEVEGIRPQEKLREIAGGIGLSAIVALASEKDVPFFDKAAVRHSQVSQGPNGWVLTQFPEAVPLPPIRPSILWDERGQPLIPDPTFTPPKAWPNNRGGYEERTIASFGEVGAIRSYRFTDWLAAKDQTCHWLDEPDRSTLAVTTLLEVARDRPATATYLWRAAERLFVLGPRTAAVEFIARHHQVEEPTEALAALRGAIGNLNPWRRESWNPVRDAIRAACGLDLNAVLNPPSHEPDLPRLLELEFPDQPRTHVASTSPDLEVPRRFLEELATRDVKSSQQGDAFLFLAMSEAPIRYEPKPPNGLAHVIFANLGAGHLVEVAAYTFPGEPPGPLVDVTDPRQPRHRFSVVQPRRFDGRNVRLQITDFTSELLEGTALTLVAKKKRAAAAAAQDD